MVLLFVTLSQPNPPTNTKINSVKRHAPLMPSSKDLTLNSPPKLTRSFCTIRKSCLAMVISGRSRLQRICWVNICTVRDDVGGYLTWCRWGRWGGCLDGVWWKLDEGEDVLKSFGLAHHLYRLIVGRVTLMPMKPSYERQTRVHVLLHLLKMLMVNRRIGSCLGERTPAKGKASWWALSSDIIQFTLHAFIQSKDFVRRWRRVFPMKSSFLDVLSRAPPTFYQWIAIAKSNCILVHKSRFINCYWLTNQQPAFGIVYEGIS